MKAKCFIVVVFLILLTIPSKAFAAGEKIAVIAPSVSTSMEARTIMYQNGFVYADFRDAQAILVVIRSMLFNPLFFQYDSVKDLDNAANMQLNICGSYFHIYLFTFNSDLSVTQVYHDYYDAD